MNNNEHIPRSGTNLTTTELNRRDLLQMTKLSESLGEYDVVFLSNRGVLNAVMMEPERVLHLLLDGRESSLAVTIQNRITRDKLPILTEKDISILRAIDDLQGKARLIDIAEYVGQPSSNIHRSLQNLVDTEIIDRADSGEITYSLTNLGKQTIQER